MQGHTDKNHRVTPACLQGLTAISLPVKRQPSLSEDPAGAANPACLRAASESFLTADSLTPPVTRRRTGEPSTIAGGASTSKLLLLLPLLVPSCGVAVAAAVSGSRSTPAKLPSS